MRPEGPSGVEGRCGETPPSRPFDFGLWPGQLDLHLESAWRSSTLNLLRRPLAQGAGRIEGRVESKDAVGGLSPAAPSTSASLAARVIHI